MDSSISHFQEKKDKSKIIYKWFSVVFAVSWISRSRKASKWKRVIRRLKQSIGIQKNRRDAIIRQARSDVAQLLHNAHHHLALSKVEQIHRDQCRLAAYIQLEGFCDCILTNLSDFSINRHNTVSDEAREAVSSMIYASTRCGELPELNSLRDLFKQHFGQQFERNNAELLPGNTVNSQIKQNLTRKPPTENIKLQLTYEIANEYAVSLGPELKLHKHDKDKPMDSSNNGSNYKNSRGFKMQIILQKIRSNFTLTSSKSETEQNFYHETFSNNIESSFEISSNDSVSIQGKGIVPGKEDLCSTTHYTDMVTDQRYKTNAKYACKERNIEVEEFHGIEEYQKSPVTHVHPKLPEYESLVARFMDLKRQNAKEQPPLSKWMRW